jgi:hypothetical protein
MKRTLLNCLALVGLASMMPAKVDAQCRKCASQQAMLQPVVPMAAAQANCTISQTRPVVTTQLRPQAVTTFRDVTETQMQQKQVVENVPVTTTKNVTVDEGGFQMVWVPKPVTKQVAETTVQQQVKTVSVPVQVTRRVPQMATQMVPVQSVQYVTEHVPVQAMAIARPACTTCGNGQAFGMPLFAPQMGYVAPAYQAVPYATAVIPQTPASFAPTQQTASISAPAFQPTASQQETAPARSSSEPYETVPARGGVPMPKDEATSAPAPARKTSMFNGVPSAAAVWQSKSSVTR